MGAAKTTFPAFAEVRRGSTDGAMVLATEGEFLKVGRSYYLRVDVRAEDVWFRLGHERIDGVSRETWIQMRRPPRWADQISPPPPRAPAGNVVRLADWKKRLPTKP